MSLYVIKTRLPFSINFLLDFTVHTRSIFKIVTSMNLQNGSFLKPFKKLAVRVSSGLKYSAIELGLVVQLLTTVELELQSIRIENPERKKKTTKNENKMEFKTVSTWTQEWKFHLNLILNYLKYDISLCQQEEENIFQDCSNISTKTIA